MKFSEMMNEKREEGKDIKLVEQVCKKMQKGKTVQEIAEELEEEQGKIEIIFQVALKYHANLEAKEMILDEMNTQ